MLVSIVLSQNTFAALMFALALATFVLNWFVARKSNEKFKREQMDKKLDVIDFKEYKSDHQRIHDKNDETDKEFRDWMKSEIGGIRKDLRNIISTQ